MPNKRWTAWMADAAWRSPGRLNLPFIPGSGGNNGGGVITPPVATYARPGELAGAADILKLNYEFPANAIHMDPSAGNDSNPGTQLSPVRTFAGANTRVAAGGTIVVYEHDTDYIHEGIGIANGGVGYSVSTVFANIPITKADVTVQPAKGHYPIIDGSTVQTGWTKTGSTTWSKPLVITLDRSPGDQYGKLDNDSRGIGWLWTRSQRWRDLVMAAGATSQQAEIFPIANYPEQVWIDGVRQEAVATLAECGPGKFFVEGTGSGTNGMLFTSSRYHLGTDPTGKEVRVVDLCTSIAAAANNVTIKGMKFRRFGNSISQSGVVKARSATGVTFENVIVEDCQTNFSAFAADGTTWRQCESWRGGVLGWASSGCYNLTWDRCKGKQCNFKRYNWAPVSGAVKVTTLRNGLIINCDFSDNWTKGWWDDVSCYNIDVVNTALCNNEQFGGVFEIGAKRRVVNCILSHNGKDGALHHDSNEGEYWHSAFKDNGKLRNQVYDSANPRNLKVYQDKRRAVDSPADGGEYPDYGRDTRQPLPDPTINNWVMESLTFYNNVFDHGNLQFGANPIEDLQKNEGFSRPISEYGLKSNGNLYCRASASNPTLMWMVPRAGALDQINVSTFTQWKSLNGGQDLGSREIIGASPSDSDGILIGTARTTYGPGGSAGVTPQALPADLAALIGVAPGTYPPGPIPIPVAGTVSPPAGTRQERLASGTTAAPKRLVIPMDSSHFGAAVYGNSNPKWLNSWPGQFRTNIEADFGNAGTGIVLCNKDVRTNPAYDPRFAWGGSVTDLTYGLHRYACWQTADGAANYVEFTTSCTEFVVYAFEESAGQGYYSIDGGTARTLQLVTGQAATISAQTGLHANHAVFTIPAGSLGQHTLRVWGVGVSPRWWAFEGRTGAGRLIVDNVSISGKAMGSMGIGNSGSNDETNGLYGKPILRTMLKQGSQSGAYMMGLYTNEWTSGSSYALTETRIRDYVAFISEFPNFDPFFYIQPQPSPALGNKSGGITYTQMVNLVLSIGDEFSIPVLNNWKLFAAQRQNVDSVTDEQTLFSLGKTGSPAYFADDIHPNDAGSALIRATVRTFLGI